MHQTCSNRLGKHPPTKIRPGGIEISEKVFYFQCTLLNLFFPLLVESIRILPIRNGILKESLKIILVVFMAALEPPSASRSASPPPLAEVPEEIDECTICMENISEKGSIDSCRHIFCFNCILNWSKVTNKCPICQASFVRVTEVVGEKPPEYDTKGRKKRARKPKSRKVRKKQQRVDYSETGFAIARDNERNEVASTHFARMFQAHHPVPWIDDNLGFMSLMNHILEREEEEDEDYASVFSNSGELWADDMDSDDDDDEIQEITDIRQMNRRAAGGGAPTTRLGSRRNANSGRNARYNARARATAHVNTYRGREQFTITSSSSSTSSSGAVREVINLVSDSEYDSDVALVCTRSASSSSGGAHRPHTTPDNALNSNSDDSNTNVSKNSSV